ncbi:MAG: DUF4276 family protein [Magnetococcales bacterium]|nr:DUF4276 family protein [Magnetococcales bacterium]
MKFHILVEGISDKTALWYLLPGILGPREHPHMWYIHKHKGIGSLSTAPHTVVKSAETLLGQLPTKLKAYGQALKEDEIVVVLLDLDDKDQALFCTQMACLVAGINPMPNLLVCFAIEELEAWYLGDMTALFTAFPEARKQSVLVGGYVQDSICGTWELLVRVTLGKDPASLSKRGRCESGEFKTQLANKISPHMDVDKNLSPSFQTFRDLLRNTANLPLKVF